LKGRRLEGLSGEFELPDKRERGGGCQTVFRLRRKGGKKRGRSQRQNPKRKGTMTVFKIGEGEGERNGLTRRQPKKKPFYFHCAGRGGETNRNLLECRGGGGASFVLREREKKGEGEGRILVSNSDDKGKKPMKRRGKSSCVIEKGKERI